MRMQAHTDYETNSLKITVDDFDRLVDVAIKNINSTIEKQFELEVNNQMKMPQISGILWWKRVKFFNREQAIENMNRYNEYGVCYYKNVTAAHTTRELSRAKNYKKFANAVKRESTDGIIFCGQPTMQFLMHWSLHWSVPP